MKEHIEKIICPECNTIQEATVKHTTPFWTYLHVCKKCRLIIMESEWETIEKNNITNNITNKWKNNY